MGESRNVQCMCRNGYRGSFCDQSFSESGTTLLRHSLRNIESVAFESQSVACVDNEFEFLCPHGGSILVDFAAYGNIGESDEICLTSVPTKVNVTYWEECIHPSSLQTMISMCQGLTYCRIKDLQSLFPDSPCLPTTPITLQYRMRCLFEPMTTCPLHAIYQNGRCYVPYVTEEPLSMYNAQTKCRKEGGQLAFSVGQVAQNEIAAIVRKQAGNDGSSCYWMDGRLGDSSLCECYYISRRNAFWSQRNCNSSQQWVCQFAPESKPTEIYDKFVEQHAIVDGLTNVESAASSTADDETSLRMKRSFCEEYDWDGITVPRTLACTETQIPCPDPENTIESLLKGVTTQKCSCELNGWEGKPNTTNCIHKWVGLLDQMINSDAPAEHISRKWVQFLQNSTNQMLFGGDLVASVEIGRKLLSLARVQYAVLDDRKERYEKAVEFTQMYGEAGNELLSDHATNVWLTLSDDVRIHKVSSLISGLEQSATLFAEFIIENQKKIEYSNWAFEVQVKKPILMAVSNVGDNDKSKLVRRSPLFGVMSFTGPNISSSSTNAYFNESSRNGNVTFSFSLSPVLLMPPLKILWQSTQTAVLLSTLDDSGLFARPRSRLIPSNTNPLVLAYYVFRSVGALLNINKTTITNSLIIEDQIKFEKFQKNTNKTFMTGASVNDPANSIPLPESYPVNFKFYHIRTDGMSNPRCVFWDAFKK
uniref:EGF-like domain-containing protein n=1 Tax=Loa loa TaxID=7209 RepID=A0A1I7VX01_LOALO